MKKKDIILLSVIILVAIIAFLIFLLLSNIMQGSTVIVSVDGETVAEFPLDQNTEYLIESKNGGSNLLIIENGKAFIREASCPDKICVNMGAASEIKPISCMPNGVVVRIEEK